MLQSEKQLTNLNSEMDGDKNASKVPRSYMGIEGGTSAEVWLDNLTALKAVQKCSDAQTLEAALLALHGVAGTWKINEKEDVNLSVTVLSDFRVAFLERF